MLKAIPNKNAGFIILLTSIFILFYFGEIRILIIFIRLMDYKNSDSAGLLLIIIYYIKRSICLRIIGLCPVSSSRSIGYRFIIIPSGTSGELLRAGDPHSTGDPLVSI